MGVYKGKLSIAIAGTFASAVIDPPERSGYINEVTKLELYSGIAVGSANWTDFIFGLSAKVPARTTFDEADGYEPDIIGRAVTFYGAFHDEDDAGNRVALDEDAVFMDTLKVCLGTKSGAGAAVAVDVYYRLTVEERKLTDSLRQLINERAYS